MRTIFIILIATAVTILNLRSYGELDDAKLEKAKIIANSSKEINLSKTFDWSLGFNFFKIIHFAEFMFISEISRQKFLNPFK